MRLSDWITENPRPMYAAWKSHLSIKTNKGERLEKETMLTLETKKAGVDIFILD